MAHIGSDSRFYMKEHDDFNFTCSFSSQYDGNVSDIHLKFLGTQVDDSVINASTHRRVLADRVDYSIKAVQAEWARAYRKRHKPRTFCLLFVDLHQSFLSAFIFVNMVPPSMSNRI